MDRLHRLINAIGTKIPGITGSLGSKPEYLLSAYGLSFVVHVVLLAIVLVVGLVVGREATARIRATIVDTELPQVERLDSTELLETDRRVTLEPIWARTAPELSPRIVREVVEPDPELEIDPLSLSPAQLLPTASTLSTRIELQGDGVEHVDGVEGAIDRLALEILQRLEQGRLLVIWAFDASQSLQSERGRLADHIDQVYQNTLSRQEAIDAGANDGNLATMVVAFGSGGRTMLSQPTTEPDEVTRAIRSVPPDTTGTETTFQTTIDVAKAWGRTQIDGKRFEPMLVIITDEVGDDEAKLERAIQAARRVEMPVYVLGSSSLFGRVEGYMSYRDPRSGRFYSRLPVRQGPESVALEQIRLPFWGRGPQYNELDSGFGPYGLSRLAASTGGIYFVTRMGDNRPTFDPAAMLEYRPDWFSASAYQTAVSRSPIRSSVLNAARITQQNLPRQPSLNFPAASSDQFKEAMENNQVLAARVLYTVEEALVPILRAQDFRDRETSKRWQAHYDLIKARLLAMKVRCYVYDKACAQMKTEPLPFQNEGSNAWRLVADQTNYYSPSAESAAQEATELLEGIVTEHGGTPWALLAQRELRNPFGFRWVEHRVPPPAPRRQSGGGNPPNNRRQANRPDPPPPPKL